MRPHEVENWVLSIVDRVEAGQPIEDSRVELKSDWVKPQKAARRIAGHANAARGARILWIVGVDERQGVVGADREDLADWYPKVQSRFDGLCPEVADYNVPVENRTVVALVFQTNRVPFVVKNPCFNKRGGGPVELEVPWREGTRVRSARRADLLRLLSPLQQLPEVEVIGGGLAAQRLDAGDESVLRWTLNLTLYVTPLGEQRVVIPFHRCECTFWVSGEMGWKNTEKFSLYPPQRLGFRGTPSRVLSDTVSGTPDEVLIHGPGKVILEASVDTPLVASVADEGRARVSLLPTSVDIPLVIRVTMRQCTPERHADYQWCLNTAVDDA